MPPSPLMRLLGKILKTVPFEQCVVPSSVLAFLGFFLEKSFFHSSIKRQIEELVMDGYDNVLG